jgi:hypothetical protein
LGERTLIFGSVYHVMNSTYIHLRTKDPNIYMYRRGEYIKNPLDKYNNKKANTYLIYIYIYIMGFRMLTASEFRCKTNWVI